jgi:Spy/CpxP family protein refolding chaperone
MFTRIILTLAVIAMLCSAAFTLGGRTAHQGDTTGIPPGHPIMLALQHQQELGLSPEQIDKLTQMRDALAKEFAPLREQVESIQHQMQELQQSGKPDEETAKKLQREGEELGAKIQPLFERYAKPIGDLLTTEQREKLMKLSQANSKPSSGDEFGLMVIMQSREQLRITPQQFTKLQYLQADFIRAFAPLREKMELLQMEVQEKFGKAGKEPTQDYQEIGMNLQKQVAALQSQISDHAINDVLEPQQRARLAELLHGEHPSAKDGG